MAPPRLSWNKNVKVTSLSYIDKALSAKFKMEDEKSIQRHRRDSATLPRLYPGRSKLSQTTITH